MSRMKGYMAGINLGGWISQYSRNEKSKEHFESFITEADIARIASLGFDHLRLPVDHDTLEGKDPAADGCGYTYIDRCLDWCEKYGLNVVLDMHTLPGYYFDDPDSNIFDSPACQDRSVAIWEKLAERYRNIGKNLWFELLNEVKADDPGKWNSLANRMIQAIRAIDPHRVIVVGGVNMNNIESLPLIRRFPYDDIVYNFHMYIPFQFTHQRADFVPQFAFMKGHIPYPCTAAEHNEVARDMMANMSKAYGREISADHAMIDKPIDIHYMRGVFETARRFKEETGLPLYCGEYGAHENCGNESRANYVNDIASLCTEYGIGRAMWSYRRMGFGLVDDAGEEIYPPLTQAAVMKI